METISAWSAVVTALSTAVIGVAAFVLSLRCGRQAAQRAIGDLAIAMVQAVREHPHVVRTAREWPQGGWDALYGTSPHPRADELAQYYAYVQIGLEFCNSTMTAHRAGHLSNDAYSRQYHRLVRLFIIENWPIVSDMSAGAFLSDYMRDEIAAGVAEGLNWEAAHRNLPVPPTASAAVSG